MSARSSRRDLALALIALASCGKGSREPGKPEADPAQVKALAATMARNVPTPAAARECTPADLVDGVPMTFRSLLLLGDQKVATTPEESEWINPPELDTPTVRTLLDPKASKTAARQAAAELLRAKAWIAYKVDMVNAPMALGVKELKIGTVGTRVIKYDHSGVPMCVQVFFFQNDQAISDQAIAVSDRPTIDPAVAKALRDDLTQQWIKQAPRGTAAAAPK